MPPFLLPGSDEFVRSLARGFAVLQAFRPDGARLTTSQIAKAVGLSRSGARRILLTLERLGYVGGDQRGFYLTSAVLTLREGYLAQPVWQIAKPILQATADALDETVSAGVLVGPYVFYTVRVTAVRRLMQIKAGSFLPAHATSTGRVLLAAMPQHRLHSYFRQAHFEALTPLTVASQEAVLQRLAEVRERGWACVRGEVAEGMTCVSVPLLGADGDAIAALNATMPSERATKAKVRRKIVPALKRAAEAIAEALSLQPLNNGPS